MMREGEREREAHKTCSQAKWGMKRELNQTDENYSIWLVRERRMHGGRGGAQAGEREREREVREWEEGSMTKGGGVV